MGNHSTLSIGVSPDISFNFERFYGRFNGIKCVWDYIAVVLDHIFLPEKILLVE